ncbi:hypothetical protein EJ110_NYTH27770, partial [Nymphaea thermarum]
NSGSQFIDNIINGHPRNYLGLLRLDHNSFITLCNILKERNLVEDGWQITIEEQVAMFLLTVGHNEHNCACQNTFQLSGQTISNYVTLVLRALCQLGKEYIGQPNNDTPYKTRLNPHSCPYFKVGLLRSFRWHSYTSLGIYNRTIDVSAKDLRVLYSALDSEIDPFVIPTASFLPPWLPSSFLRLPSSSLSPFFLPLPPFFLRLPSSSLAPFFLPRFLLSPPPFFFLCLLSSSLAPFFLPPPPFFLCLPSSSLAPFFLCLPSSSLAPFFLRLPSSSLDLFFFRLPSSSSSLFLHPPPFFLLLPSSSLAFFFLRLLSSFIAPFFLHLPSSFLLPSFSLAPFFLRVPSSSSASFLPSSLPSSSAFLLLSSLLSSSSSSLAPFFLHLPSSSLAPFFFLCLLSSSLLPSSLPSSSLAPFLLHLPSSFLTLFFLLPSSLFSLNLKIYFFFIKLRNKFSVITHTSK